MDPFSSRTASISTLSTSSCRPKKFTRPAAARRSRLLSSSPWPSLVGSSWLPWMEKMGRSTLVRGSRKLAKEEGEDSKIWLGLDAFGFAFVFLSFWSLSWIWSSGCQPGRWGPGRTGQPRTTLLTLNFTGLDPNENRRRISIVLYRVRREGLLSWNRSPERRTRSQRVDGAR